ncbi:hypothetical protein Q9L58_010157 [Maublancomyces gigas]|uniref:tyrosinase n=1 Tax=Discina gigas TaxID=1032678 RepID=A0ABR3G4Y0_9PEZI
MDYVDITGVKEGIAGGAVPLRTEIREFALNADMFNIYILGLQRMQALPKTDKLSWYQIAGIHGRPYKAWDNVGGNGNRSGYCTHSSILFLPWHRPYIALYEQTLFANVKAAVAAFPPGPTKDKYTRLVPSFRVPYWDFAAQPALPDIILNKKQIEVTTPTGKQTINNPLYCYNFGTIDRTDFPSAPFNIWLNTLRQPSTTRNPQPNDDSRPTAVATALDTTKTPSFPPRPGRPILNLRDRIYALLSKGNYQNFQYFSNDGWNNNNSPDDYDSLESVHNNIHVLLGGPGHMSDPGYAAFDPVFWLHHVNVDRLFAMWQVLNPTSYVVNQTAANSTFWSNGTDNPNTSPTIEGPRTPLLPFHANDTTYWTSETARNLKSFGSTYPELVDWGVVGPDQVKANVQAAIQRLYGKTAPVTRVQQGLAPSVLASGIAPAQAGPAQGKIGIPQTDGPSDEARHSHESHAGHSRGSGSRGSGSRGSGSRGSHSHDSHPRGGHSHDSRGGHSHDPHAGHSRGHAETSSETHQHPIGGHLPSLIHDNHYHEYFANLRVEKYALGGSFNVHVFLGDFSEDPYQRVNDDNLVGTFSVFANDPETTGCEKCKTDAANKLVVTASIPLTGALLDRIPNDAIPELQTLEPEVVTPYLTRHLHWRINRVDSSAVSREDVQSLKVGVASVVVDVPTDRRELPNYRSWRPLYDVTRGRPRGIEDNDDL